MSKNVRLIVEDDHGNTCVVVLDEDDSFEKWAEAFRKILGFQGFGSGVIDRVFGDLS